MNTLIAYALLFAAGWAGHAYGWPPLRTFVVERWKAFLHRMTGAA